MNSVSELGYGPDFAGPATYMKLIIGESSSENTKLLNETTN